MSTFGKFKLEITGDILERAIDGAPVIVIDAILRTPEYSVPMMISETRRGQRQEFVSHQIAAMLASLGGHAANAMLDRPPEATDRGRLTFQTPPGSSAATPR